MRRGRAGMDRILSGLPIATLCGVATVAALAAAPAAAQDGPAYDGRYTFVRVRFAGGDPLGSQGSLGFRRREPFWAHDYPRADRNFVEIVAETTTMDPVPSGGRVLSFEDPEIFKYPVAYIVEVGFWRPSRTEAEKMGEYLRKGGFLIVDDFRGDRELRVFEEIMSYALPGLRFQEIPDDHEIWDAFFRIPDPHALAPPTFRQYRPRYLAVFEDNDPSKRIMAVLNHNNDIAEYWEYSDLGYLPIDLSNEAYKFGVNYLMYALTH